MNALRKRGWNVVDILGDSAERFIKALGYPEEAFGAFENCLKGEGVDVEELGLVDKKDKVARRSRNSRHYPRIHFILVRLGPEQIPCRLELIRFRIRLFEPTSRRYEREDVPACQKESSVPKCHEQIRIKVFIHLPCPCAAGLRSMSVSALKTTQICRFGA